MFVENKGKCILSPRPDVMLFVGVTFVPDARWDEVAKLDFTKGYIESETLVPLEQTRGKEDLKALDEKAALKIVKDMTDRKFLQALKRKDARPAVIDAIDQRLAKITPEGKKE